MPLSQDDRIAFSLQIVTADSQVKGLTQAKTQLQTQIDKITKLDTANKNLFDPFNIRINSYQIEYGMLDGNLRTTIAEQNIQDAANKQLQNYFFPNDTNVVVPDLSASHNIWTKVKPFALTYAIGRNYTEVYGSTQKEGDLISPILSFISSAGSFTNIQNTTGQTCYDGTCSLSQYTDQVSCNNNSGIWTLGDHIANDPNIQTLKNSLVSAVSALKAFLITEASIIVTNDPNTSNQALNNAAINNINNIIIPAINTWLGYADFNTAHGQTTCVGFNAFNSNLLAPTKLHSTQLAALQSAINTRSSFITTRLGQLSTIMGSISQDLSTGDIISSSGLYGQRYGFLVLRLNALGGSLSQLVSMSASSGAQDSIISNILSTKATYLSILPTSIFKAPGNGTTSITLTDTSLFSAGDSVYVMADNQEELRRAIKSVNNDTIILNDIVPAKYRPAENARMYKDLT